MLFSIKPLTTLMPEHYAACTPVALCKITAETVKNAFWL